MARRICVVTGTRAEYGLLYWLMQAIKQDPKLELQVVATAMHLEPAFGHTVDLIRQDGFTVDAEVPMQLTSDEPVDIAKSTGLAVSGLAESFKKLRPDIVVVLGDRFETLGSRHRGRTDAYSDRAHSWWRDFRGRDRRCVPPRHHQALASPLRRGRAVPRARHPDGRGAGAGVHGRRARASTTSLA